MADIEIRRVAFDPNVNVLGLNLAVELLGMNVRRQLNINVNLFQGLIPFEHRLTCRIQGNAARSNQNRNLRPLQSPDETHPERDKERDEAKHTVVGEDVALLGS